MAVSRTGLASKQSSPNASRFRDKRYTIPVLSIDLFAKVYQTVFWSTQQMLLPQFEEVMLDDKTSVPAVVQVDGSTKFGLFRVIPKRIHADKKIGIFQVTDLSSDAQELMARYDKPTTKGDGSQTVPLKIILPAETVNWSFSGMLLQNFRGTANSGDVINGVIRVPRTQHKGTFSCNVIRHTPERHRLALKFSSLPDDTFALLEEAIKKQA
ncbi:MAG: PilZ domain-containing protein [Alphaproteobacteria bacterium]|nr:PilZ domain-containing protein [Alphaproteobacteria bacterium]